MQLTSAPKFVFDKDTNLHVEYNTLNYNCDYLATVTIQICHIKGLQVQDFFIIAFQYSRISELKTYELKTSEVPMI